MPIAVFVHKASGDVLRDPEVVERIARAFECDGTDAWYTRDPAQFLGPERDPADYEQVMDIVDVWFESGSTHATVLEQRPELEWPATLYLEGSDQHRGWFHSSLLESCGTRGRAYDAVLTHGFVVDAEGRKMSKSLGNVISPLDLMKTMGADILRLWTVSADYAEDLRIGDEILAGQADAYRRLRNTLRFLLGNLAEFREAERLPYEQMPELERWVLHRLSELDRLGREGNASFDFRACTRPAQLLRHRPVGVLLRRAQGLAVLRPAGQRSSACGAYGARSPVPLPGVLARLSSCSPPRLGSPASPLRTAACICVPSPRFRARGAIPCSASDGNRFDAYAGW